MRNKCYLLHSLQCFSSASTQVFFLNCQTRVLTYIPKRNALLIKCSLLFCCWFSSYFSMQKKNLCKLESHKSDYLKNLLPFSSSYHMYLLSCVPASMVSPLCWWKQRTVEVWRWIQARFTEREGANKYQNWLRSTTLISSERWTHPYQTFRWISKQFHLCPCTLTWK